MNKNVFNAIKEQVNFGCLILGNLEGYCEEHNLMGLMNKDFLNVYIKHFDCFCDLEYKAWLYDFEDIMKYIENYIDFEERTNYKGQKYGYNYNMKISHEIDEYNNLYITLEVREEKIYIR